MVTEEDTEGTGKEVQVSQYQSIHRKFFCFTTKELNWSFYLELRGNSVTHGSLSTGLFPGEEVDGG